jgi:RND family efflux transporter MFP subunit
MKPALRNLLIAGLVLVLIGAAVWRAIAFRQAERAAAAAAQVSKPAFIELGEADIARVQRRALSDGIEISGSIRAVNTALVKARVAAEVKSLSVREGDAVRAGQVLAQLDTTEFEWRLRQAEQQAQSAKAQWDIAQRTLANNRALVAQGFISPTALDSSVSSEAAAQATHAAAMAAVELARKQRADATLASPIAGLVSQRFVQPGERVGIDARLLEVVDLSKLELEVTVPPEQAGALRVGLQAQVRVEGVAEPIQASVVRINPSAQSGSRALLAYLSLASHPSLRHGLFAKGRLVLRESKALAVPAGAIRLEGERPQVLVVEQGQVRARTVELGPSIGDALWQEVSAGLTEGQAVLMRSAGRLADGTAVRLPGASPVATTSAATAAAASTKPSAARP